MRTSATFLNRLSEVDTRHYNTKSIQCLPYEDFVQPNILIWGRIAAQLLAAHYTAHFVCYRATFSISAVS